MLRYLQRLVEMMIQERGDRLGGRVSASCSLDTSRPNARWNTQSMAPLFDYLTAADFDWGEEGSEYLLA